MQDWLLRCFAEIQKRLNASRLLLLNNFLGHEELPEFSSVKYWLLSPNTTSVFQQIDQGVMLLMKHTYRKFLLEELIDALKQTY